MFSILLKTERKSPSKQNQFRWVSAILSKVPIQSIALRIVLHSSSNFVVCKCFPFSIQKFCCLVKSVTCSNLKGLQMTHKLLTHMVRSVLYRIKTIVGKAKNAGYQPFLLFPQCLKRPSPEGHLPFPKQALVFTCLKNKSFEITEKKRNCLLRAISLFPLLQKSLPFSSNLKLLYANSFS